MFEKLLEENNWVNDCLFDWDAKKNATPIQSLLIYIYMFINNRKRKP